MLERKADGVHVRILPKHYAGVKPAAVATSLCGQPRDSRFLAVRRYLAVP